MFVWNQLRCVRVSPILLRIVRLVGLFLTIFSLALTMYQGASQFSLGDWRKLVMGLLVGWGAYGASFGLQGIAWCLLMGTLSQTRIGWHDLEIYAYSNLMRRTPGMVWHWLERVESYQQRGQDVLVTLRVSVTEWFLLIYSAAFVYAITCQITLLLILVAFSIVGFCIAGAIVGRRKRQPDWLTHSLVGGIAAKRWAISLMGLCVVGFVYGICYIFGGIIVFALVQLVDPISPLSFVQAINLWALVGGIGLLTLFIPVNVGVREITLAVVLLPFTSTVAAVTVAAMMRVIFASADVIFSIGVWRLSRWFRLCLNVVTENRGNISGVDNDRSSIT